MFLLLDIKHKTYAKSKPQQQKNWLPKVSVYANRLKIKNVSILFNLLIGETIFFFGILVYLIDMLPPKLNNFRRLYLMQRYIAETWEYLF